MKRDENYDLAVGGSRQQILNGRSYSASSIFCFDQNEHIASYQPAMMVRKGFPLESKINEIIQDAFESGLFIKWHRNSERKLERAIPNEPPTELTLKDLRFAFVWILLGGYILSTLAFISELIISRQMKQPSRSWIWAYLEQFFDGERHYFKNLLDKSIKKRQMNESSSSI